MSARLVLDESCPHCGHMLRLSVQTTVEKVAPTQERVDAPPGLFDATEDDLADVEAGLQPVPLPVPDVHMGNTVHGVFAKHAFDGYFDLGEPEQRYGAHIDDLPDVVSHPEVNGGQGVFSNDDPTKIKAGDVRMLDGREVRPMMPRWGEGDAEPSWDVLVLSGAADIAEHDCVVVTEIALQRLPLKQRGAYSSWRAFPRAGDLRDYGANPVNQFGDQSAFYLWRIDGLWRPLPPSPLRLHGVEYCCESLLDRAPLSMWSTSELLWSTHLRGRHESMTPPSDVSDTLLHPTESVLMEALERLARLSVGWADEHFRRRFLEAVDLASRTPDYSTTEGLAQVLAGIWRNDLRTVAYSTSPRTIMEMALRDGGRGLGGLQRMCDLWEEVRRIADAG